MNKKTILGTIAGGVAYFLLGWLIYGLILGESMENQDSNGFMRKNEEMIWWALILSNFIWAYFLTWIFQIKGTGGLAGGLKYGAMAGLLMALGYDLGMYAMSNMFPDIKAVLFDVVMSTIMSCLTGAVIGLVIGMKQEAKETNKS